MKEGERGEGAREGVRERGGGERGREETETKRDRGRQRRRQ